jgi:serine protease Do
MMRVVSLLMGAVAALSWGLMSAQAQQFEPPPDQTPVATITYDGKKPSGLQYGDISLTVDSEPVSGGPERLPVVTGRYKGQMAFTIRLKDGSADNGQEEPAATVSLIRIDPSSPAPQVVLSYFWGGAHCCTLTRIATLDEAGQWHIVDGGALDGEGYQFKDLDGNGGSELISVDNSFLYAFDCYACSYAPTQIHKLVGAALNDVTREPQYQPFLRFQLRQMEAAATRDDQLGSNGYLGGWVASKALVGELSDAWQTMLARYDRQSDWPMQECLTGVELDKCPPDKLRKLNFPTALAKHLLSNGYITSNELQHLQVPSP